MQCRQEHENATFSYNPATPFDEHGKNANQDLRGAPVNAGNYHFSIDSARLGLPATIYDEQLVRHFAYSLSYNEPHELASWVAYTLTAAHTHGTFKRSGDFRSDPAIVTGSANEDDYRNSGYDRGHLAPAADMKWSKKAMDESFLFSNVAPQLHAFNAGIWEKLEEAVRRWALNNRKIYIVAGPVFDPQLETIGRDHVAVPKRFYKVILDLDTPEYKAIGFIIPNEKATLSYWNYALPIDSVERITGIDFYPLLPDSLENVIESRVCIPCWKNKFKNNSQPLVPGE